MTIPPNRHFLATFHFLLGIPILESWKNYAEGQKKKWQNGGIVKSLYRK
jgi:hypothetical protein